MRLKILLCFLFIIMLVSTIWSQSSSLGMYIVNDRDGYVHLRQGPGVDQESYITIRNKTVVKRDFEKKIEKGWVPVLWNTNEGYIFQDRLRPVDKLMAQKIDREVSFNSYGSVYQISLHIPELFVFSDNDCELVVKDLKKDTILFSCGVPVCYHTIWSDTLSFYHLYELNWEDTKTHIKPMFSEYKLYKKNGNYGFYAEISPEPLKVSKEEAESMVKNIRKVIKEELEGDGALFYLLPDFHLYCCQLFIAYCSGVDAWDIIENSACDASICHDLDSFYFMKEAYDMSQLKPVIKR